MVGADQGVFLPACPSWATANAPICRREGGSPHLEFPPGRHRTLFAGSPIRALWQVQDQSSGGAGEPSGDGDQMGAHGRGGRAGVEGGGEGTGCAGRLNAIAAQTSHALLALTRDCLILCVSSSG
jgi:hypothetical protein